MSKLAMSETPRTDEAEINGSHFSDWGYGPSGYVYADFARQLERELQEATQMVLRTNPHLDADYLRARIQARATGSSLVDAPDNA